MKDLARDTYVLAADTIIPLLERASAAQPVRDDRLARAMDVLKSWNRYSSEDSVGYTYLYYWARLTNSYSKERFERFDIPRRRRIDLDSTLEQTQAWKALEDAVDSIQKTFGKPEVRWGDISFVARGGNFPLAEPRCSMFFIRMVVRNCPMDESSVMVPGGT